MEPETAAMSKNAHEQARRVDTRHGPRQEKTCRKNKAINETGEGGSPGRTRTSDPAVNSRLLYQLSYRGIDRVTDRLAYIK